MIQLQCKTNGELTELFLEFPDNNVIIIHLSSVCDYPKNRQILAGLSNLRRLLPAANSGIFLQGVFQSIALGLYYMVSKYHPLLSIKELEQKMKASRLSATGLIGNKTVPSQSEDFKITSFLSSEDVIRI